MLGADHAAVWLLQDSFEMQADAIKPGQTVIVIDDLIATGGSAKAAGELVAQLGGKVEAYLFIIECVTLSLCLREMMVLGADLGVPFRIEFLKGAAALDAPTFSLIKD